MEDTDSEEEAAILRAIQIATAPDDAAYFQRARDLIEELGEGVGPYLEAQLELARVRNQHDKVQEWFRIRNCAGMIVNNGHSITRQ
ncbi:hypothetical protein WBP06_03450 [Novosphingobium sp. BL-8H]|uniref:hypothetical protein n=1 Tax=Novosphingobium sp. BL-8H TaxID=3127640 RepID=UPI0037582240